MVLRVGQRRNLLWILNRQRLQQEGVHQAENGRVGADAQRQCQNRSDGKAGRFSKLTQGKAKILQQDSHGALLDSRLSELHKASSQPNFLAVQTIDFD
jgi:hypothetical protein